MLMMRLDEADAPRGTPRARPGSIIDVGANNSVPLLGDGFLGRTLLVERREHGLVIGLGRRQLCQDVRRDLAVLGKVVEADRMAIALQPAELAFIRIEILHPELGGVRMRRVGADRLNINAGNDAGLRHDDFDAGLPSSVSRSARRIVVPAQ